MEIKRVKDYITHQKDSGYRSYHMIIYYNVETMNGKKRLQVEIQIRTLAMNFWSTIEHSLQYKYKGNMPPHVKERLINSAEAVQVMDQEMSAIRDNIMDAKNMLEIRESIVADILNNIQNLYKIANKREVEKIQDEFYRVYETGEMETLEKFHRELDLISESYRAQEL